MNKYCHFSFFCIVCLFVCW